MPSALLLGLAATSSGMVKGSFFSGSCHPPPVFVNPGHNWGCGSASRWCGSGFNLSPCFADPDSDFLFDADPDPTFHPDTDPDPDPSLKKGSNPWKSAKIGSYSIHFGLTSASTDPQHWTQFNRLNRCGSCTKNLQVTQIRILYHNSTGYKGSGSFTTTLQVKQMRILYQNFAGLIDPDPLPQRLPQVKQMRIRYHNSTG